MIITRETYFKGRDVAYRSNMTDEIEQNAAHTIVCANAGLALYRADCPDAPENEVNSGWRPPALNAATPGAAPMSRHMKAQAVDISDPDGNLALWSVRNKERLIAVGILGMERPEATKGWAHWQTVSVGANVFVFWPTMTAYNAWKLTGKPLIGMA